MSDWGSKLTPVNPYDGPYVTTSTGKVLPLYKMIGCMHTMTASGERYSYDGAGGYTKSYPGPTQLTYDPASDAYYINPLTASAVVALQCGAPIVPETHFLDDLAQEDLDYLGELLGVKE